MKIILDSIISKDLKDHLLSQKGITNVDINIDGYFIEFNIKYTEPMTPFIILKEIDLYEKYEVPNLFEFDKETPGDFKTLKYVVKDMCCEYCYKGLVTDLFNNKNIKSVKSNFEYDKPAFNIEFIVEYNNLSEEEVIKLFKY